MAMSPGQCCLRTHPMYGKLADYASGTRWYVFAPLGTSGHPLGDWLRYEFFVPRAIYSGGTAKSALHVCMGGVLRGKCFAGFRARWDKYGSSGGTPSEEGSPDNFFTTARTNLNSSSKYCQYAINSPLSPAGGKMYYRVWMYRPGTQRSPARVEHRDTGSTIFQSDVVPCWHTDGDGPFVSDWKPIHPSTSRIRVNADPYGGSSYDLRFMGIDVIDLGVEASPDESRTIAANTVQGALFHDGDDGSALEVVPYANRITNQAIFSRPSNEIAVYHDAGSGGHASGARSYGGASHQGVNGGTIVLESQNADGAWEDATPAAESDAIVADLIRVGNAGATFYLQSDLGGGTMGDYEGRCIISSEGLVWHNVATYTAAARLYDAYTALCSLYAGWYWVRFGNQGALVKRDPSLGSYSDRKARSMLVDLGPSGILLEQIDTVNEHRGDSNVQWPRVANTGGFYKAYMTQNSEANGTLDKEIGEAFEARSIMRFTDRAKFWAGMPASEGILV